jgi:hypothetical protein
MTPVVAFVWRMCHEEENGVQRLQSLLSYAEGVMRLKTEAERMASVIFSVEYK